MARAVSIATAGLAGLAVVAIAVAIVALQKGSNDLTKIHHLEGQVHVLAASSGGATKSVGSRVQSLEQKLEADETTITATAAKGAKTEGALRTVTSCIPELQSELNGLELERSGETIYIKNSTNVSRACSNTLYGADN